MLRPLILTAALVAVGIIPAQGQLLIDFNSTSLDGGPHPESGYESFDAAHETSSSLVYTRNYEAFGSTISLNAAWPNTSDREVRQMIDRGSSNDANWSGDKIDLLTDWIGIDTRTGNGGNGNYDGSNGTPTYMTLRFGGLPSGSYSWRSYHHDTENVHVEFLVEISTNGGSSYTQVAGPLDGGAFRQTDSTSGGNPASPQTYTGIPNPDPADLPSTVEFSFTATAGQDLVIRFTPLSATAVHTQLFGCNGVEIRLAEPPALANDPATDTTPTSATIGGTVTDVGGETPNVTIYWGNDDAGTNANNWDQGISLGAQSASFTAPLGGLSSLTTYYYRCFASSGAGSAWATSTASFTTTGASAPTVVSHPASGISFEQADAHGEVTVTGGEAPVVTVFFGTTDGGTNPGSWDEFTVLGAQSGPFTNTLLFLTHDTTYHYRFRAVNGGGTSWSVPASFTTLAFAPATVTTGPADFVTGNSAQVSGEVTDTGDDSPEITIYYGDNDGGTTIGLWDHHISIGPQGSTFTAFLTTLPPLTTHYYRVYAINGAGGSWAPTSGNFTTGESSDFVVNEFMANNDSTVVPGSVPGTIEDWIEIHNAGPSALDLGGWHLTDSPLDLNQWTFPANTIIPSGGYLVVFASGDNTVDANGFYHTNFKLGADGDYIALVRPTLTVASEHSPGGTDFPGQADDVSYGLHPLTSAPVFFHIPTPGAANDAGGVPQVADTKFTPDRGYYQGAQSVTLTTTTTGATIYYTTDGQPPVDALGAPTPTATAYSAPIAISSTTVLRAAGTMTGHAPTNIDTHSYILLDIDGANPNGTDPAGLNTPFLEQTRPRGWGNLASGDYNMDEDITKSTAPSTGHGGDTVAQSLLKGLRDIPTLSIALDRDDFAGGNGIYSNPLEDGLAWERICSAEFLPANGDFRNAWQEDCGLRVQGGASRQPYKSPKHSLSLRFRDIYGPGKLREVLFPGSPVSTFNSLALRAVYNNSWIHFDEDQRDQASMIRDQWMRDAMFEMGHPDAGQGMYVHIFVNGLYWGVHNLHERQEHNHYAEYHGGDDEVLDAYNGTNIVNGNSTAWNAMQSVVAGGNWAQIQEVLDVDTYIDYTILNRFGANQDLKSNGNWRAVGGGPYTDPEDMATWRLYHWDSERILESPTASNEPLDPMGIRGDLLGLDEYRVRFADRVQKHFFNGGALTPARCKERWMTRANDIDRAVIAEAARWGDHRLDIGSASEIYDREDDWLTEQNRLVTNYFPVRTGNELANLRGDGLFPAFDAPVFTVDGGAQHGGTLPGGSTLSLTTSTGTIYYTTDGSDPREVGGSISPAASSLSSGAALPLSNSSLLRARVRSAGGEWSALTEATFVLEPLATPGDVAIVEINYHPYPASPAERAAAAALPVPRPLDNPDDFEFFEIQNISAGAVNLLGASVTAGVTSTFGNVPLAPGDRIVLVRDPEAFEIRYGPAALASVAGTYSLNLSNAGEAITLLSSSGALLHQLTYGDSGQWPERPDGDGSSLEIINPALDGNDPNNWRPSCEFHGTPGSAGTGSDGRIVINEIRSHPLALDPDVIELHNTTGALLPVGGWFLTDQKSTYKSFEIPSGTGIPDGGYLTIDATAFNATAAHAVGGYAGTPGTAPVTVTSASHGLSSGTILTIGGYGGISDYNDTFEITVLDANSFTIDTTFLDDDAIKGNWSIGRPFGLSGANGDDLWLVEADGSGKLLKFVDHVEFAAARAGETLGRWPNGAGNGTLVTMTSPTLGTANPGPVIGPVVISEVMYFPDTDDTLEFVELCNTGPVTENLANWKLRGGVDFDFTSAHSIPPGGSIVMVGFDPLGDFAEASSFRSAYGIDSSIPLVGPWTDGPLNDDTGTVRIQRPDTPPVGDPTYYPQVTEDEVVYQSAPPWPVDAGGTGASLQRLLPLDFGLFPTSWFATSPNPGDKQLDYKAWRDLVFGPGAPAGSARGDDPDGDGLNNELEYLLGLDPLDPNDATEPSYLLSGDQVTATYTLNTLRSGTLELETSPNLIDWSPLADSPVSTANYLETRSAVITLSTPRLFIRLAGSALP